MTKTSNKRKYFNNRAKERLIAYGKRRAMMHGKAGWYYLQKLPDDVIYNKA